MDMKHIGIERSRLPLVAIWKEVISITNIKKLILSIELTQEDRDLFIRHCCEWKDYCYALQKYDKLQVMKLIKYLITERISGRLLLSRAISRFNRLNALKGDDLK